MRRIVPLRIFAFVLFVGVGCTAFGQPALWSEERTFLGQNIGSGWSAPLRSNGYPPLVLEQQSTAWNWQLFPDGIMYPAYLAGVNESRFGSVWNKDDDFGWIWDITLGGQMPLLRYGNRNSVLPEGFQLDIEGSVHLRLDIERERDLDAADFRFGMPISYAAKRWQFKTGYYHVSSHLGDERMLRLQLEGFPFPYGRTNYIREAWIFGVAFRPHRDVRLYAEADFAFWLGEGTKPWHFQFGAEYSPIAPTGGWVGRPFAAVHARFVQERNYDGNFCVQCGWQWRGPQNQALRVGLQYFTGISEQYEYVYTKRENKLGLGVWLDF